MTNPALLALIDQHRKRGYVPFADVTAMLRENAGVDEIERAYAALAAAGLNVVDRPAVPVVHDEHTLRRDALLAIVGVHVTFHDVLDLGERLRKGKLRVRDVVVSSPQDRGTDPSSPESEAAQVEQVLRKIDRIRKLERDVVKIKETLASKKLSEMKRKELKADIKAVEAEMVEELQAIRLNKKQIDRIVAKLNGLIKRVEEAERELLDCERRVNMPLKKLKHLLRDSRNDDGAQRRAARKLNLSREDYDELDRIVRTAIRKIMRVQEEAKLPAQELKRKAAVVQQWHSAITLSFVPKANRERLSTQTPARSSVLASDLRALVSRLDDIAARATVSTALPSRRQRTSEMRRAHDAIVAFTRPRRLDQTPAPDVVEGVTYADLGRVGEGLVFAMMRQRWERAAHTYAEHTRALLQSIALRYWSFVPSDRRMLDDALAQPAATWFGHECVRQLLWPSQTMYGDAMGFDIFGMNDHGDDWLCLEVKTTQGPPATQFELTVNEYRRAQNEGARYTIARVSHIHRNPPDVRFWHDPAALIAQGALTVTPSSFVVSFGQPVESRSPSPGALGLGPNC